MVFVSYLLKNKLYTHTNDSLERKAGRHVSPNIDKYRVCLMFVDPCIIVDFMKKNTTKCNNVSKFYSPFI
jgi:hypothetical protein